MMKTKYTIDEILLKEYNSCISTLKECSKDDSKGEIGPIEYLCDSEKEVYDFDQIQELFSSEYEMKQIKSMDSLFIKDDKIYLIEFKNQTGKRLKWDDIKLKVHESILILSKKFALGIDEYSRIEVIVVYAPNTKEQKSLNDIRKHFKGLIKEPDEIQQFELFKKIYDINCFKFSNSTFKDYISAV